MKNKRFGYRGHGTQYQNKGERMMNDKNNISEENKAEESVQAEVAQEVQDAPVEAEVSDAEPVEAEVVDNFDAIEDGEETEADSKDKEIEDLKAQLEKEKKEYMFLMAEFDNFRKRTLKEKSELIKNAGESVFKGLLPIVDDMERGIKASETATDVQTVREGEMLVYNKLVKFMAQNGVKPFDEGDDTFDAEKHEAITAVPVEDESKKGKILDTIEKGYTINDKVLRHARVVVGQ